VFDETHPNQTEKSTIKNKNMSNLKETYITPKNNLLELKLAEVWRYKDLLFLFVKRDIVTVYKQTILGPLWYLIQPLFTSVIFTIVFNSIAGISTGGVNSFLYNLAGITIWNYFSNCINGTSDTFKQNENLFGKVYFPRMIIPISVIISNLVKFSIQVFIFICFYIYFSTQGTAGNLSFWILIIPLFVAIMGLTGLGLGMISSSLTSKYRDVTFLVQFGVQLLMYLSAVMYPLSLVQEKLPAYIANLVFYNPLAVVIDNLRKIVFLDGMGFTLLSIIFPIVTAILLFLFGLLLFNKTEKSFIDTI
jgi:lipopolysaccharide transport system permease protein